MLHHFTNILFDAINVDPQTKQLIDSILNVLLPILYTIAGGAIVFSLVRFGLKVHSNPEQKGEWIKQLVWSLAGILVIFCSTIIANIIQDHFLHVING